MKNSLLRAVFILILLSTSQTHFYPLAPKSQLHDLNIVLPSLGRLAKLLIPVLKHHHTDVELTEKGPEIFSQLEEIIKTTGIRIHSYQYKRISDQHSEIIFYIQDINGAWLKPIVIAYYLSESLSAQAGLLQTQWGKAEYKGPLTAEAGASRSVYFTYELPSVPSKITGVPFELLYKQYIIYSLGTMMQKLGLAVRDTFIPAREIMMPLQDADQRYIGVKMSIVRQREYLTEALKNDRFQTYQKDLYIRIQQFFEWMERIIPVLYPYGGLPSLEQLAFFVRVRADELMENAYRSWNDGKASSFLTGSPESIFKNVDSRKLAQVFLAVGINIAQLNPVQNNELQVFGRILDTDLKILKDRYRRVGKAVHDESIVKEAVEILQRHGFIAGILEINSENLWHDEFDFLPKVTRLKRSVVLVKVAGEFLILDLTADLFAPKDQASFYAAQNPIPSLDGQGVVNPVSVDFKRLDQYQDLGIVAIPVRTFWQERMRQSFMQRIDPEKSVEVIRQEQILRQLQSIAITIIENEGNNEVDVDVFTQDLQDLMGVFDLKELDKKQKELLQKYGFTKTTFRGPGREPFPQYVNSLIAKNEGIIGLYRIEIIKVARQFFPYLGEWRLVNVDGSQLYSAKDFDLNRRLLDPLGLQIPLFFNGALVGFFNFKFKNPSVVDFSRLHSLETAA